MPCPTGKKDFREAFPDGLDVTTENFLLGLTKIGIAPLEWFFSVSASEEERQHYVVAKQDAYEDHFCGETDEETAKNLACQSRWQDFERDCVLAICQIWELK